MNDSSYLFHGEQKKNTFQSSFLSIIMGVLVLRKASLPVAGFKKKLLSLQGGTINTYMHDVIYTDALNATEIF